MIFCTRGRLMYDKLWQKQRLQTSVSINLWKILAGHTGDWFDVKTALICTTELWDALKSFILTSLKFKVAPYPIIVSLDTLRPERGWNMMFYLCAICWGYVSQRQLERGGTKEVVMSNCARFGHFPAIPCWDQFSKRNKEHSLRNSLFSVQLCTVIQRNWATLMAFLTNFANEFCHTGFTSTSIQNWTYR